VRTANILNNFEAACEVLATDNISILTLPDSHILIVDKMGSYHEGMNVFQLSDGTYLCGLGLVAKRTGPTTLASPSLSLEELREQVRFARVLQCGFNTLNTIPIEHVRGIS